MSRQISMNASEYISILSVFIAIFAVFVSHRAYRGTVRSATRPVLVFSMTTNFVWRVSNVGSGPAVELRVADYGRRGVLSQVTKCYPLAAGEKFDLPWVRNAEEIVAIYRDVFGSEFTTICRANENKFYPRRTRSGIKETTEQWLQDVLWEGRPRSSLREADLIGKTAWELDVMRNTIYAKHGYIFNRKDLSEYFSQQEWYRPQINDHRDVYQRLNAKERYEAHLILDYQQRAGLRTKQN